MLKRKKNAPPFIPRAVAMMTQEKRHIDGYKLLLEGARVYFLRIQKVLDPFPTADTALIIRICRHMADELERQDPAAKDLAEQLKTRLELPPIEVSRQAK